MSDRTSAALFGEIFTLLYAAKTAKKKIDYDSLAKHFWDKAISGEYDFNPYQMDSDTALIHFGLARKAKDEEEEYACGSSIIYADDENF